MLSSRLRTMAIINAVVLVTAVLSIGQVRYAREQHNASSTDTVSQQQLPGGGASSAAPSGSPTASPGASANPSASPLPGSVLPGPGGLPGAPSEAPVQATGTIPDFGLKTQGVTAHSVTIGMDYDVSGCGGADSLSNGVSSSVTGDPKKSAAAFIHYINDTGGIRGRTLKLDIVDDGGEYCPEKHKSAEIQLVEQDKVFMDLAGLHEVSELLAKDHIPFLGGESSVVAQRKQGFGQFAIYQDAEGDFQNWASFGRYYLNSATNAPCLAHPDTADFNSLEPILVGKMSSYGLKFKDILRYTDSVQNAAGQAETAAVRMKTDGCKQVWLLANNAIAAVFFTAAASQQNWFPTWTWTSRTAAIDADNVAGLMNQREWQNSVGLSIRVPAGKSPYEGNCAKIYEKYYPGDNEQNSAATQIACAQILTAAEAMRRAVDVTGVLTADSLMLGVNAIHNDFYFDSTVPMRFSVPDTVHTPIFNGFWMQTVAKWDSNKQAYQFPEFPSYWQTMGPSQSGRINILPYFRLKYSPPKG